jgi:hypothetical protein
MIEIIEGSPELLPALNDLFVDRFGHELQEAEWRWKYSSVPGRSRSLVGLGPDGRVLAHAGAIGLEADWSGGRAILWQAVDWAGRSGGGLRPPLLQVGRRLLAQTPGPDDVPWIYGFPSERHFRLGLKVFGYRAAGEIVPWTGDLPEGGKGLSPEIVPTCDTWAETAWAACRGTGIRRTAHFLNWRYHARPERYYRLYRVPGPGIFGLIVAAFVGEDARLTEVWLPEPIDVVAALTGIANDLRSAGLSRWSVWPAPRLDPALLARLGLVPGAETRVLACRAQHHRPDCRPGAASLDYAMGDYDAA